MPIASRLWYHGQIYVLAANVRALITTWRRGFMHGLDKKVTVSLCSP